jgi:hypothetical protein
MIRWTADEELSALIRTYYTGEAALWPAIRQRVDDELRRRAVSGGAYHIRLLKRADDAYDVLIEDAGPYAQEP